MTMSDMANQPLDADARRTALEIMATLVNVKRLAADHLLRPAGVPQPLINEIKGACVLPTRPRPASRSQTPDTYQRLLLSTQKLSCETQRVDTFGWKDVCLLCGDDCRLRRQRIRRAERKKIYRGQKRPSQHGDFIRWETARFSPRVRRSHFWLQYLRKTPFDMAKWERTLPQLRDF